MAKVIERKINNYLFYIFENKFVLSEYVANFIESRIKYILQKKDNFQFCVCGGSTPKNVYKLLSTKSIQWNKVDIFLGDERCVDPSSEESNSQMLKKSLLMNFGASARFHEIFEKGKEINDINSKQLLISLLNDKCKGNPPIFDLTILGLGDDGHTASLFPYKKINHDNDLVIFSEGKGLKRISLTPKIFSASRELAFLVSGSSKQIALKRLINEDESVDRTPAKLIKHKNNIIVFCDYEASKQLPL